MNIGIDTSLLRLLEDKSLCAFCVVRDPERKYGYIMRKYKGIKGEEIRGIRDEENVLGIFINVYRDIEEEIERYLGKIMSTLRRISLSTILRIFMIPHLSPYRDIESIRENKVKDLKLKYQTYIIMREVFKFHKGVDVGDIEIFSSRNVKYPHRYVLKNDNVRIYDELEGREEKNYESILNLDQGYKEYVLSILKEDH